jgi:hypothetical protein
MPANVLPEIISNIEPHLKSAEQMLLSAGNTTQIAF